MPLSPALLDRHQLAWLDLVVLTTYTDRELSTVDQVYYFANGTFLYDYGGAGLVEFGPYLLGVDQDSDAMAHLPGGAVVRRRRIRLRNGPYNGTTLWEELSQRTLDFSRVEVASIALEQPTWDGRALSGSEHQVMFRGEMVQLVGASLSGEIVLDFETEYPQLPWLYADDEAENDPKDLGLRLPVVFGQARRIPAIGWIVGRVTTLAEAIDGVQNTIELTDASGIEAFGEGRIGGEEVLWSGKSGNTLTGVTRGHNQTLEGIHAAGESFFEFPLSQATWIVAAHAVLAIDEVYVQNPVTRDVVRVTTPFSRAIGSTSIIPGETVAAVQFTNAQLRDLIDELLAQLEFTGPGQEFTVEQLSQQSGPWPLEDNKSKDNAISSWATTSVDHPFIPPPGTVKRQTIVIYVNAPGQLIIREGSQSGNDIANFQAVQNTEYRIPTASTANSFWQNGLDHGVFRREVVTTEEVLPQTDAGIAASDPQLIDGNISTGPTSGEHWVTFATPTGTYEWQRLRMYKRGTPTDQILVHIVSATGPEVAQFGSRVPTDGSSWYEVDYAGTADTFYFGVGLQEQITQFERVLYYKPASAGAGQLDKLQSIETGYGLVMYADVDGVAAPDASYVAAQGALIERPVDVFRYVIQELMGRVVADLTQANLDLGANIHALDLRELGEQTADVLAQLGFQIRANIVPREESGSQEWALLPAKASNYEYSSLGTFDFRYTDASEIGLDPDSNLSRFLAGYEPNPSREGSGLELYDKLLRVDRDRSDIAPLPPSTADLAAAEARWGRRDALPLLLAATRDPDTAEDVTGFYAHEWSREAQIVELVDVPWTDGWDLRLGDVATFPHPLTGASFVGRLVSIARDERRMRTLRFVEVQGS